MIETTLKKQSNKELREELEKGLLQLDLSSSQFVVDTGETNRVISGKSGAGMSSDKIKNGGIAVDGMFSGIRTGTGGQNHFMDTSGLLAFPTSTHNNTKISKFIGMIPQSESQVD